MNRKIKTLIVVLCICDLALGLTCAYIRLRPNQQSNRSQATSSTSTTQVPTEGVQFVPANLNKLHLPERKLDLTKPLPVGMYLYDGQPVVVPAHKPTEEFDMTLNKGQLLLFHVDDLNTVFDIFGSVNYGGLFERTINEMYPSVREVAIPSQMHIRIWGNTGSYGWKLVSEAEAKGTACEFVRIVADKNPYGYGEGQYGLNKPLCGLS